MSPGEIQSIPEPATGSLVSKFNRLMSEYRTCMVDYDMRLNGDRPAGVVVAATQFVAEPTVGNGISFNSAVGKECRFSEQLNLLIFFFSGINAHGYHLLFVL